jgi:hypothetical protein
MRWSASVNLSSNRLPAHGFKRFQRAVCHDLYWEQLIAVRRSSSISSDSVARSAIGAGAPGLKLRLLELPFRKPERSVDQLLTDLPVGTEETTIHTLLTRQEGADWFC